MKPAAFDYVVANSLAQAIELKAGHGSDARWLAGGQSLLPMMNFRLAQPALLIDINPVRELDSICESEDGSLRIGALRRYRALERDAHIRENFALLHEAVVSIAHPQIRNRGTLGGNLAHADPASQLPAVMLALGARMKVQSRRGARWLDGRDFFLDVLTTALADDEILAEIELPALPPGTGTCFLKVARRPGDYPLLGTAAVVTLDAQGKCVRTQLGYCNAGRRPMLAQRASDSLRGLRIDEASCRQAANLVASELDPQGNVHATKAYQRHLAGVLTQRALRCASARALRRLAGQGDA